MSSPSPTLTPTELLEHVKRALDSVKDLTTEQQQAALEAATATARAASELRARLFMAGTIAANLGRR